jgi:hypothetical protein
MPISRQSSGKIFFYLGLVLGSIQRTVNAGLKCGSNHSAIQPHFEVGSTFLHFGFETGVSSMSSGGNTGEKLIELAIGHKLTLRIVCSTRMECSVQVREPLILRGSLRFCGN